MGFARILGSPNNFSVENIRSPWHFFIFIFISISSFIFLQVCGKHSLPSGATRPGAKWRRTGENGGGNGGGKGWGILAVGGVLYLFVGHADRKGGQAQLAWSRNHARTWTFADWKFSQFGLLGFVNFGNGGGNGGGKDYAGARDDYVYAYSHDAPLADKPADSFVLLRAPMVAEKDKIVKWRRKTGFMGVF